MKTRLVALIFSVSIAIYGAYIIVGYLAIKALSTTSLIDVSLYPQNIAEHWRLLPFRKTLVKRVLFSKTDVDIREDFHRYGFTLYSGVVGYRDVRLSPSDARSSEEIYFLREVASHVLRAGVGLDWVDGAGCTAIHQALIEGDIPSAKFLIHLGGGGQILGIPDASFKLCRLDVDSLAATKGLSLK